MKRNQSPQTAIGEFIRETPSTITCNAALETALAQYQNAKFIAIDTEFMRERTYYPQLCLIQISDGQIAVAIDPLAPGLDLSPFWELLKNPAITKVLHAGGQDMEIFLHRMEIGRAHV